MHREATRLLQVIDQSVQKGTASGAGIEVTYGQVYDIVDGFASVYIVGSRELAVSDGGVAEPSPDFRIPSHLTVAPEDHVRVSMDRRGDRWIDEVLAEQPSSDLSELTEVKTGTAAGLSLTYNEEILARSPLTFLKFGEASGTVAEDATSNNRDGTYVASPTLGVASGLGDGTTAVTLNGTTQLITIADNAVWDFTTGPITIIARVKHNGTHGTFGDYIFGKGTLVPAFWLDTSGFLTFSKSDEGNIMVATSAISDTNWHTVGVSYHNGVAGEIYLDGVAVGGAVTDRTFVANGTDVAIGQKWPSGNNDGWHGSLSGLAVFNSVISGADHATIHAAVGNAGGSGSWTEKVRITDKIEFSGNSTERDVNLYRYAANILKTDDALHVLSLVVADPETFAINSSGTHIWGDGTTQDTNLYRQAANLLKTDDAFQAGGAITAGGAVSGASVAATGAVTGATVTATGQVSGASLALGSNKVARFVPITSTVFNAVTRTSSLATTDVEITAVPSTNVVAVTGFIAMRVSDTSGPTFSLYDYDGNLGARAMATGVANRDGACGFTVATGGTNNRQIKYSIAWASGTVTYSLVINGYWTTA